MLGFTKYENKGGMFLLRKRRFRLLKNLMIRNYIVFFVHALAIFLSQIFKSNKVKNKQQYTKGKKLQERWTKTKQM